MSEHEQPQPNTAPSATQPGSASGARKRIITSCTTCRRRKVRCDRAKPECLRCTIGGYPCSYTESSTNVTGRRGRESGNEDMNEEELLRQQMPKPDLMQRLKRLEQMVQFGMTASNKANLSEASDSNISKAAENETLEEGSMRLESSIGKHGSPSNIRSLEAGRLLRQDGRTRYVSSTFWGVLAEEVHDLSSIFFAPSTGEHASQFSSPVSEVDNEAAISVQAVNATINAEHDSSTEFTPSPSPSFIFPATTVSHSLNRKALPVPQVTSQLYEIFKFRVNPLVRLLHIPTFDRDVSIYLSDTRAIPHREGGFTMLALAPQASLELSFEALLLAICYAAVKSLTERELEHLQASSQYSLSPEIAHLGLRQPGKVKGLKASLLYSYKTATEIALSRARLIEEGNLVTITALTILLILNCHEADPAPDVYSLTGLLLRLAQAQGLHRDPALLFNKKSRPSAQNISQIEVEVRRRLWHHICHLDVRTCEAFGPDPGVGPLEERMWPKGKGTRLPRCIDDEDLPDADWNEGVAKDEDGEEDPGRFTLMSMQLMRFHVSLCFRKILVVGGTWDGTYEAHEIAIDSCRRSQDWRRVSTEVRIEFERMLYRNDRCYYRYARDSDEETEQDPFWKVLRRLTATAGEMIDNKVWIIYYHRFVKNKPRLDESHNQSLTHAELQEDLVLRKRILAKSLSILKYRQKLLLDPEMQPYRWHIEAHTQLHAAVHILWELECAGPTNLFRRELGMDKEEAWNALRSLDYTLRETTAKKEWEILKVLKRRVMEEEMRRGGGGEVPLQNRSSAANSDSNPGYISETISLREASSTLDSEGMDYHMDKDVWGMPLEDLGFGQDVEWDEMSRLLGLDMRFPSM